MFMTIIWNTENGAKVKHLQDTNWIDASNFLIRNKIADEQLKCVEFEEDGIKKTIINNFDNWFYNEYDLNHFV